MATAQDYPEPMKSTYLWTDDVERHADNWLQVATGQVRWNQSHRWIDLSATLAAYKISIGYNRLQKTAISKYENDFHLASSYSSTQNQRT